MMQEGTRLERLYRALEVMRENNLPLAPLQQQIKEQEEKLIREEVLPTLSTSIEPMLRKIESDLFLVVDYRPGQPVAVRIARKRNLSDLSLLNEPRGEEQLLGDAAPEDFPSVRRRQQLAERRQQKQPATRLRVVMPNGEVLAHRKAKDTLCAFIQRVGLERVRQLGLKCTRIPLVATAKDPQRSQQQVGNYYISTCSSTEAKRRLIEKIAQLLAIPVSVSVIDK